MKSLHWKRCKKQDLNMKFINVGSGSKGNSTLIYSKNTTILVDCGVTKKRVVDCLKSISRSFESIDAIFITHRHSDHAAHLSSYDCFASTTYSGDEGVIAQQYKKTNVLNPFQEIEIGDFVVRALPTSHDAPDSMGYLFKEINNDETLLYMTDTGFIPERDLNYMKNCDFYLIESNHDPRMLMNSTRSNYLKMRIIGDHGHLSNEQCSHYLSMIIGDKTKEIDFAHLSEECNTPKLAINVFHDVMRIQCGEVPSNITIKTFNQKEPTSGGDSAL